MLQVQAFVCKIPDATRTIVFNNALLASQRNHEASRLQELPTNKDDRCRE